jgi:hypothetical protein
MRRLVTSPAAFSLRATVAAARGCDLAVLAELVPAAEAGFVEALCADADRPH